MMSQRQESGTRTELLKRIRRRAVGHDRGRAGTSLGMLLQEYRPAWDGKKLSMVQCRVSSVGNIPEPYNSATTLYLSKNQLTSLEGIETFSELRALSLGDNPGLVSPEQLLPLRALRRLEAIHLDGCPLASLPYARAHILSILGWRLGSIDGAPVTQEEVADARAALATESELLGLGRRSARSVRALRHALLLTRLHAELRAALGVHSVAANSGTMQAPPPDAGRLLRLQSSVMQHYFGDEETASTHHVYATGNECAQVLLPNSERAQLDTALRREARRAQRATGGDWRSAYGRVLAAQQESVARLVEALQAELIRAHDRARSASRPPSPNKAIELKASSSALERLRAEREAVIIELRDRGSKSAQGDDDRKLGKIVENHASALDTKKNKKLLRHRTSSQTGLRGAMLDEEEASVQGSMTHHHLDGQAGPRQETILQPPSSAPHKKEQDVTDWRIGTAPCIPIESVQLPADQHVVNLAQGNVVEQTHMPGVEFKLPGTMWESETVRLAQQAQHEAEQHSRELSEKLLQAQRALHQAKQEVAHSEKARFADVAQHKQERGAMEAAIQGLQGALAGAATPINLAIQVNQEQELEEERATSMALRTLCEDLERRLTAQETNNLRELATRGLAQQALCRRTLLSWQASSAQLCTLRLLGYQLAASHERWLLLGALRTWRGRARTQAAARKLALHCDHRLLKDTFEGWREHCCQTQAEIAVFSAAVRRAETKMMLHTLRKWREATARVGQLGWEELDPTVVEQVEQQLRHRRLRRCIALWREESSASKQIVNVLQSRTKARRIKAAFLYWTAWAAWRRGQTRIVTFFQRRFLRRMLVHWRASLEGQRLEAVQATKIQKRVNHATQRRWFEAWRGQATSQRRLLWRGDTLAIRRQHGLLRHAFHGWAAWLAAKRRGALLVANAVARRERAVYRSVWGAWRSSLQEVRLRRTEEDILVCAAGVGGIHKRELAEAQRTQHELTQTVDGLQQELLQLQGRLLASERERDELRNVVAQHNDDNIDRQSFKSDDELAVYSNHTTQQQQQELPTTRGASIQNEERCDGKDDEGRQMRITADKRCPSVELDAWKSKALGLERENLCLAQIIADCQAEIEVDPASPIMRHTHQTPARYRRAPAITITTRPA